MTLVIGVHLWTVYLRNEIPIGFYPIQRYQTPVAIGLIVVLSLALLVPATARRLAGWPWTATAVVPAASPIARPSVQPVPVSSFGAAGVPETRS
jgi:hypothetical protein